MKTWNEFAALRPDMAGPGRSLFYEVGVGLAYMATTRPDGGPRLHPMCPIMNEGGLFAFIIPSPKQRDLRRDGRYALHSFPRENDEDGFSCMGMARLLEDSQRRFDLSALFVAERSRIGVPPPAAEDALFEFLVDSCLVTKTTGHGDPHPVHQVWRDT